MWHPVRDWRRKAFIKALSQAANDYTHDTTTPPEFGEVSLVIDHEGRMWFCAVYGQTMFTEETKICDQDTWGRRFRQWHAQSIVHYAMKRLDARYRDYCDERDAYHAETGDDLPLTGQASRNATTP